MEREVQVLHQQGLQNLFFGEGMENIFLIVCFKHKNLCLKREIIH